jgi:hypothetical protein
MNTLDRCAGKHHTLLGNRHPAQLAVQIVVHVGDSSQATERDPNRHPDRPVILERTAGPPPPADFWSGSLLSQDLPKLPRCRAAVWTSQVCAHRIRSFASAEFVGCSRLEVVGPACMRRSWKRRRRRCAPLGYCKEILRCQCVVPSHMRSVCFSGVSIYLFYLYSAGPVARLSMTL